MNLAWWNVKTPAPYKETCMRREKTLGLVIVATLLLGSVSSAFAQYQPPPQGYPPPQYYPPPPPPPRGMYRDGFLIGVGIGFGGISADACGDFCGGALALELHLGGMINPRMGVMGDFWGNFHPIPNSDGTTSHSISTLALQYWLTDIIWLKGGLGIGRMQITSDSAGSIGDETGFAIMGAGGIELVQATTFALDLQLRLGHGFYSQGGDVNNLAFMAGFNWY
jgi:hypothetical protein